MKKISCPVKPLRQYVFAIFIYLAIIGTILFTILKIRFIK